MPSIAEQLNARLKTLKPEENYLLVLESVTTVLNAVSLSIYAYRQLLLLQQRMNNKLHALVSPR
jgi:hypothetical protein